MGMTPFIAGRLVFGSAGVPPVGLRGVKAHKITGETPALPKPLPKFSLIALHSQNKKLVRNANWSHAKTENSVGLALNR